MAAKKVAFGGIRREIYATAKAQADSHGQHLNEYIERTLIGRWSREGVEVNIPIDGGPVHIEEPACNQQPEPDAA